MNRFFKPFLFIITILLLNGCGLYSFTGASISPDIKSISIQQFPNLAPLVQPTLSQVFTLALRDKFSSQTNLSLVQSNGDLNIEGEITGYSNQPIAIQGNQQAALNRLTITVKVRFSNKKNEKQDFETTFSRYRDYSSQSNLSAVEGSLIEEINKDLVEDIFNKAVVNW
jgi:hypothetical protein